MVANLRAGNPAPETDNLLKIWSIPTWPNELNLSGENLYVEPLGSNTGKVVNVACVAKCTYDDVIRYAVDDEKGGIGFVEVLTRANWPCVFACEDRDRMLILKGWLTGVGIKTGSPMFDGCCLTAAIPVFWSPDDVDALTRLLISRLGPHYALEFFGPSESRTEQAMDDCGHQMATEIDACEEQATLDGCNNLQRAGCAADAIYACCCPDHGQLSADECMKDTLADLIHFCRMNGIPWSRCLASATYSADEERRGFE